MLDNQSDTEQPGNDVDSASQASAQPCPRPRKKWSRRKRQSPTLGR